MFSNLGAFCWELPEAFLPALFTPTCLHTTDVFLRDVLLSRVIHTHIHLLLHFGIACGTHPFFCYFDKFQLSFLLCIYQHIYLSFFFYWRFFVGVHTVVFFSEKLLSLVVS
ncbi:hypothetical protein B0T21DRAFT_207540 [Apiosordaria backusii]|uniref:Uncharacterized protein n=1 Tax=Apiosordaria backusii TaxID=314023 RepID=A0AA40B7M4_9PEZI|nr:hypothetical protein B0T21DRAFT_207540 [Apiosordaria backusii]